MSFSARNANASALLNPQPSQKSLPDAVDRICCECWSTNKYLAKPWLKALVVSIFVSTSIASVLSTFCIIMYNEPGESFRDKIEGEKDVPLPPTDPNEDQEGIAPNSPNPDDENKDQLELCPCFEKTAFNEIPAENIDETKSCKKFGSNLKEIHIKELVSGQFMQNGSNQTYTIDMRGDNDYCVSPTFPSKKLGLSNREGEACYLILDDVCKSFLKKDSNSTVLN